MQQFVHLGIHTEFSITESIVRIPDLIKTAVKQDMPALALTDLSNLHAAVKFYKSCLSKGIKPILGCECYYQKEFDQDAKSYHLCLFAKNVQGYRNLNKIITIFVGFRIRNSETTTTLWIFLQA